MKKKTKRKYWIAAIVWLATMILANSINELPCQPADTRHHRGLLDHRGLYSVQGPDAPADRATKEG